MKCKKCSFDNLTGTKYCQNCGNRLKEHTAFLTWGKTKVYAGMGHRGSSLAPLGAMAIEKQGQALGKVTIHKELVKVQPLQDGSWYCPDCGELNKQHSQFCKGCGRDF